MSMFWKKKKRMIDLGDLHRRGVVIPQNDSIVPTNEQGFVELGNEVVEGVSQAASSISSATTNSGGGMFGFLDNPASTSSMSTMSSSGSSASSDDLRKITERLERLDNILYKLEQRIELIERKMGVGGY